MEAWRAVVQPAKMFHMCWAPSDGSSKLIPIDEQPNHQIVHLFRLGKAPIRRLLSRGNTLPCATFDHFFRFDAPHRH